MEGGIDGITLDTVLDRKFWRQIANTTAQSTAFIQSDKSSAPFLKTRLRQILGQSAGIDLYTQPIHNRQPRQPN